MRTQKCCKEFVVIQQSGTNTRYSDKLYRSCYLVGVVFKYFQAMLLKEPKMIMSFRNKAAKFRDKLNIIQLVQPQCLCKLYNA